MPLLTTETIEGIIHRWLDMLAAEKYEEALNMVLHDPYYQWTSQLLAAIVKGYGLPHEEGEPVYKVTDWRTAASDGSEHNRNIEWFDEPRSSTAQDRKGVGAVYYDLPLNGEWSDLTAMFNIVQISDDVMLELMELHVL